MKKIISSHEDSICPPLIILKIFFSIHKIDCDAKNFLSKLQANVNEKKVAKFLEKVKKLNRINSTTYQLTYHKYPDILLQVNQMHQLIKKMIKTMNEKKEKQLHRIIHNN